MKKTSTFRRVRLAIEPAGYGQYIIRATYRGQDIAVRCTDSEVYDYIDDPSDSAKHMAARRKAYNLIKNQF